MIHGIYVDLPYEKTLELLPLLAEHTPITELRVMVETHPNGERRWTHKEFYQLAETWEDYVGAPHLRRVFPVLSPRPGANREYALWASDFAYRVYADVESQAVTKADREDVLKTLNVIGCRTVVTTHQGHPETEAKSCLISRYIALEIQAYSTGTMYKRTKMATPGRWQEHCIRDGLETNGCIPSLALALYGQSAWQGINGYHPVRAIEVAYQAAKDGGVRSVGWWSLRHFRDNSYALPAMKRIKELEEER